MLHSLWPVPQRLFASSSRIILRHVAQHVLVLGCYLALSILTTWPLLMHLGTGIVAKNVNDALLNIWNMWWTNHAITQQQNPFWTSLLFYPQGVQLYVQTLNISNGLLTLPIQALYGPIAAYNAAVLLGIVLTGYGIFLLVRAFVPNLVVSAICGACVTLAPFHMEWVQAGQSNLISTQWVPLYLVALFRLREQQPWSTIVWAIIACILVILTDWYWALVCAPMTIVWWLISVPPAPERQVWIRRQLRFAASAVLCLLPLLIGLARSRETLPSLDLDTHPVWADYVRGFSADALALALPARTNLLWGSWAESIAAAVSYGPFAHDGWYMAAGWGLLLCASIGIWVQWQVQWRLLALGGAAWLLSLGPTLRIAGFDTGIPMPYQLIMHLPPFSLARKPSLFAVVCVLILAIFTGIGLHWLLQRWRHPACLVLLLMAGILAITDLWPPQQSVTHFTPPTVYTLLRSHPGAVADLPFALTEDSRTLYNQIIHQQPILGGYVPRWPNYHTLKVPLIDAIASFKHYSDITPARQADFAAMQCAYPIRHVVLRKDLVAPEQHAQLAAVLTALLDAPLRPRYEDIQYVWYELPLLPERCRPFVWLGKGWHALETDQGARWRWASASNEIWIVNPARNIEPAQIRLVVEAFTTPQSVALWRDNNLVVSWDVARAKRTYRVHVNLQPGVNLFHLQGRPIYDPKSRRTVSIVALEVGVE